MLKAGQTVYINKTTGSQSGERDLREKETRKEGRKKEGKIYRREKRESERVAHTADLANSAIV